VDRLNGVAPARLLARFGVSAEAESVWRVLMATPDASLDAIARSTGLLVERVSTAIDELLEARLVRCGAAPAGVQTIDPTLSIETHIVRAERQMAEEAEEFAVLRAQLPQLADEYAQRRVAAGAVPGFELLVGLEDIRREISLAADRVRLDLRSLEHRPFAKGFDEESERLQTSVLDRGVRDRLVIPTEQLLDPTIFSYFEAMEARGHRTRTLPEVTTRLMVYDRDLAVLPVDPSNMSLGAIFIRVRSVIDVLILMYDRMWSVATPVFSTGFETEAPTGRSARILELLSLGTKDERIARTLGVGVRTIRREVAQLKELLGVTSRPEIAAAAIRKGWL
jgi:DNA-binding CsgD family transcriptional regulator